MGEFELEPLAVVSLDLWKIGILYLHLNSTFSLILIMHESNKFSESMYQRRNSFHLLHTMWNELFEHHSILFLLIQSRKNNLMEHDVMKNKEIFAIDDEEP